MYDVHFILIIIITSIENFFHRVGGAIRAKIKFNKDTPIDKLTVTDCKEFLVQRKIDLTKEKLNSAKLEVLRDACTKYKDLQLVEVDDDDDDDDDDDSEKNNDQRIHDVGDDDEDVSSEVKTLPSVPCPSTSFIKNSGGVNDIKLRQVLFWLLDAPTDAEVLVRLDWLGSTYCTLKSFTEYLKGVRKYWSRWNKTWETTFGYQSTQGIEGWHWSIKAPLRGKVVRLNELPEYLYDIYLKRWYRYPMKKMYVVPQPSTTLQERHQQEACFTNLLGNGSNNHNNVRTATKVFNEAGILYVVYNVYVYKVYVYIVYFYAVCR